MAIHILGIRHHGPGSAKNVRSFLESMKPDIVLVEGPPEADGILSWVANKDLQPPVAILCYQPDNPRHSSFYPFAEFSPEWQAILYAKQHSIHVRFMDLPVSHQFAIEAENSAMPVHEDEKQGVDAVEGINENDLVVSELPATEEPLRDAISWLAEAAGYSDSEKWWEHMFEQRTANGGIFEAVMEAITSLRETLPQKEDKLERLREAHMRKVIRQAEKEMFQTIAVICGAWHAPALATMPKQKEDNDLLKSLPRVKVECTWIPWTYNRLSMFSGYGAGVQSPGWYDHVWNHPADDGTRWMAKVAKLFREKQMDTSVAHVLEAVRLSNALAAIRHLPKAGLEELNEATLSILCNGESILMSLVHNELIVSERIGAVPEDIPKPPLQLDIEKLQKRLRLPATADEKDYILDLRKENDLERSVMLHRLELLKIKWGVRSAVSGKGTFKEQWRLQWDPTFSIDIIDMGSWGNTVEQASDKYVKHLAAEATGLKEVCRLLENTIPAELPAAIEALIFRINNLAAASGDVIQLMEVIPGLVDISRYGNVRKTDAEIVTGIIESMIVRICISLPAASTAVDDEAAAHLLELFSKMNDAINVLQHAELTEEWQQVIRIVSEAKNTTPVIAGYSTRQLANYKLLEGDNLLRTFYYAMSTAGIPSSAAAWLEGFLTGSGTILLLDEELWSVVDNWVKQLDDEMFKQVLPLLRRTFSEFTPTERRKLGEKVKHGGATVIVKTESGFDEERGAQGIPVVMQLLALK